MPQLKRCSWGVKFVSGGGPKFVSAGAEILGWSTFLRVLCCSPKKGHRTNLVYVCPSSLLISKNKGHLTKLFYLSPSFLSVSKKKSHHLATAARERGVWVGMVGILGGQNFCLGERRPLLLPRSCGPVNTNISRAR